LVRKRLTLDIDKIVRAIWDLQDLIVYEPSTEEDFLNVVYTFLKLKFKKYEISDDPEAIEVLGKKHKPDLSIQDQVAIELKIAKRRSTVIRAINQAEMYRRGGYPASIAVVFLADKLAEEYEPDYETLERLEKRRVYAVLI